MTIEFYADNSTPLQACQDNDVEKVKQLIGQGAPVNFADHMEQWTPLHHAIRHRGAAGMYSSN